MRTGTGRLLGYAAIAVVVAAVVALAAGDVAPTLRRVTNTTSGKNQNANIDKKGRMIVFTSNTNHVSGVTNSAMGAFDFDNAGNDFITGGPHPDPKCINCDGNPDAGRPGDIYVWRLKATGGFPANSIEQLTFSTGGGFSANQFPDLAQAKATTVAWDSDQDHTGGNADGNREIFFADMTACNPLMPAPTPPCPITQVTSSTGGGGSANANVNLSDTGTVMVFSSNRDYAGVLGCTLTDGTTACDNADTNAEIMLYDRTGNKLTQITKTTGNGGAANIRPRISPDGRFVAFQSTRDFAGVLPAGLTCTLIDGTSACGNADQNGEIMLIDLGSPSEPPKLTQITNTLNAAPCSGNNPSERVEVSKKGTYVTFQSRCEAQLNPTGCISCDGNDEAFLYSAKNQSITQVTISDGGFNRVPRISGKGGWIILESNRNYKSHNLGNSRALYVVKRNAKPGSPTQTGPGQLIDDPGPPAPPAQNAKTKLAFVNPSGGFNSTIEQFGASTSGKYFTFDNAKGVGNQEVWFINRSK
jgi:Tol biopolymer transport system component